MDTNARAERIFRELVPLIEDILGHGITNGRQLDGLGSALFGKLWNGVYASDQIGRPKKAGAYIINLDSSDEPGSHWVGLYIFNDFSRRSLLFDSFGRPTAEILPGLVGYGATDPDKNQRIKQTDCGSRSMAFLVLANGWGYDLAKYV